MSLINLTPHSVTLCGIEIPPSGQIARVGTRDVVVGHYPLDDEGEIAIPCVFSEQTEITGLPEYSTDNQLIVSGVVMAAVGDTRTDVLVPHDLVRDGAGRVIGACSLRVSPAWIAAHVEC